MCAFNLIQCSSCAHRAKGQLLAREGSTVREDAALGHTPPQRHSRALSGMHMPSTIPRTCAVLLDGLHRVNHVAQRLGHLAPLLIADLRRHTCETCAARLTGAVTRVPIMLQTMDTAQHFCSTVPAHQAVQADRGVEGVWHLVTFKPPPQPPTSPTLSCCCLPHQAVQVDGVEGRLPGELDAHHDHAGHPEEEDVMARLHHAGGVEPVGGWEAVVGLVQLGKREKRSSNWKITQSLFIDSATATCFQDHNPLPRLTRLPSLLLPGQLGCRRGKASPAAPAALAALAAPRGSPLQFGCGCGPAQGGEGPEAR